jgi:hypothetical protein
MSISSPVSEQHSERGTSSIAMQTHDWGQRVLLKTHLIQGTFSSAYNKGFHVTHKICVPHDTPGSVAGGEGSSSRRPCMAWYTASLRSDESANALLLLLLPDASAASSTLRSPCQVATWSCKPSSPAPELDLLKQFPLHFLERNRRLQFLSCNIQQSCGTGCRLCHSRTAIGCTKIQRWGILARIADNTCRTCAGSTITTAAAKLWKGRQE